MHKIRFKGTGREMAVGKILCLGRNYAKHIQEMQSVTPQRPILFLKPATALVGARAPIRLPDFSAEVHHEVELVVVIGKTARRVSEEKAFDHVAGYAIGLDLTARDWQNEAKEKGEPWAVSKGFDGSAPVSEIAAAEDVGDPGDLAIQLWVNGELRQSARTSEMIYKIPQVLCYGSRIFTLEPGDLVFTGTPSGVGPLRPGDLVEAAIERVGRARWPVER